jgi:hypothetical protein
MTGSPRSDLPSNEQQGLFPIEPEKPGASPDWGISLVSARAISGELRAPMAANPIIVNANLIVMSAVLTPSGEIYRN